MCKRDCINCGYHVMVNMYLVLHDLSVDYCSQVDFTRFRLLSLEIINSESIYVAIGKSLCHRTRFPLKVV